MAFESSITPPGTLASCSPGGLSRPWWYGKQCRGLYSGGLSLYDSSPHQQNLGLTKKITVPSEVTDFEPGDPTNQLVFWVYFDKLFLQEWADKPQPHHLTIDQLTSIWGGCCTKKSSESSSYGILQFSHPKKNPGFWRVCMCVDVQDNQPCSGTYPIDRSILMDFTPSSQRGMWNAVTLGGFVHFPAT